MILLCAVWLLASKPRLHLPSMAGSLGHTKTYQSQFMHSCSYLKVLFCAGMVHFYLNSNCSPVTFDLILNDENGLHLAAVLLTIAPIALFRLLTSAVHLLQLEPTS